MSTKHEKSAVVWRPYKKTIPNEYWVKWNYRGCGWTEDNRQKEGGACRRI